ncbi:MAG: type II methionyl aminopeptidase [Candidatus Jordarchaeaceae archaeon]
MRNEKIEETVSRKQETEPEEEKFEKYRKAGNAVKAVRETARKIVQPGASILDICERIENELLSKEVGLSFPCNISVNNIAAHYTSPLDDKSLINENDVVKVDFGTHVDGYIADTAFTVCFKAEYEKLIEASEKALEVAIDMIRPGVETNLIGEKIEETIKGYGFRPIKDLSGHLLDQYILHGSKIIPNISIPHGTKIEKGEVYALETFATTGSGSVTEAPYAYIYSLLPLRVPLRFKGSRQVLGLVQKEFKTLPFAERWLAKKVSKAGFKLAIKELTEKGLFHAYNVLSDKKGSLVSQAEHTLIVIDGGCEVITK